MNYIGIQHAKMSMILDSYEDIFSSFDPRGFDQRALSDDFVNEYKKVSIDAKADDVELRILVPSKKRDSEQEKVIKHRLHKFFISQFDIQRKLRKKNNTIGVIFIFFGIIIGVFVSLLLQRFGQQNLYTTFLIVIGEPASWLLIRTGADRLLLTLWGEKNSEYEFYNKVKSAKISFYQY